MESSKKIKKGQIEDFISDSTQTALDNKQDNLNAVNLGQIIYDELAIKATPSPDDEIVMYDSITGEAVTAKFSDFGGDFTNIETTANKTDSIVGNETSSIKYPSVKGLVDWVTSLFVPKTRTITIGGVTQDLSADRTFTVGGTAKRSYYAEWKITGAMAASTNWFAQGQLDTLRGIFVATAGITPTNNFANYSIQTPCFVLPFNAKIKSYNAKGFTNGNTAAFLRSIVNSSFSSTTVGYSTIQNSLNIEDVSFQLGYHGVIGNYFRFQTDTGFSDVTLPKGTEIRLFNFNNNQGTPLQSTIISIEFEEVL